jgi:hypothetical protein
VRRIVWRGLLALGPHGWAQIGVKSVCFAQPTWRASGQPQAAAGSGTGESELLYRHECRRRDDEARAVFELHDHDGHHVVQCMPAMSPNLDRCSCLATAAACIFSSVSSLVNPMKLLASYARWARPLAAVATLAQAVATQPPAQARLLRAARHGSGASAAHAWHLQPRAPAWERFCQVLAASLPILRPKKIAAGARAAEAVHARA